MRMFEKRMEKDAKQIELEMQFEEGLASKYARERHKN